MELTVKQLYITVAGTVFLKSPVFLHQHSFQKALLCALDKWEGLCMMMPQLITLLK